VNDPLGDQFVVVVAPPTPAELDLALDHPLAVRLWGQPTSLCVALRPTNHGRVRVSDLAGDVMDLLGHTGAQLAIRKHLDTDLFRLLPFLLTSKIERMVLDDAHQLNARTCEELLAVANLAHVQLWLVSRQPLPTDVADLIALHGPQVTYAEACAWWDSRAAACESACRHTSVAGDTSCVTHGSPIACLIANTRGLLERDLATADQVRLRLAELRAQPCTDNDRWALEACTRDALRPAQAALAVLARTLPAGTIGHVAVSDIEAAGTTVVHGEDRYPVPHTLTAILFRQRIAALAAGQYLDDPLVTYFFDGKPLAILTH
jgi:hypothetical protein